MHSVNDIKRIFSGYRAGAEGKYRFFSVLLPVVDAKDGPEVLYEVRAKDMDRQPGEICFPGGEMEEGETPCECALRETYEEIGIPQNHIEVVSRLDTVYTYSNFAMHCYLGIVDEKELSALKLNRAEVDEVFTVSLEGLLSCTPEIYETEVTQKIPDDFPYEKVTGGRMYNWRRGRSVIPVYDIGGRIIWGLTARITKTFLEEIRERMGTDVQDSIMPDQRLL